MKHSKIIEEYKKQRSSCHDFMSNLPTKVDISHQKEFGKMLYIFQRNTFIFQSEVESLALIDFMVSEKLFDGKSQVDLEIEDKKFEKQNKYIQRQLIAQQKSYTSLFKVIEIDKEKNIIYLHDILNKKKVEIIDVSLSQNILIGTLMFFRMLDFTEYSCTVGVSYFFDEEDEKEILDEYEHSLKKIHKVNDDVTRYIIFFRINRNYGNDAEFVYSNS